MFILVRALTYAVFFVGLVLVYLPSRLLAWTGMVRADAIGVAQVAGVVTTTAGVVIATCCVLTVASLGRGAPAPFDPPRDLVIRGPYRFVRNPMYIGAGLVLAGAALFYQSPVLLGYAGTFLLITHLFVVGYEEPTLRRTFGDAYESYCERVRRWWPARP